MKIRIAIGCFSYLFGECLKKSLEAENEIDILGIFDEGIDLNEIVKLNPDMILADSHILRQLPDDFAIKTRVKILLITDRSSNSIAYGQITDLIPKGLVGIFPPGADLELLKKAIKAISLGELWIDRKTLRNILSKKSLPRKELNFSKKEKEVAALISQGYRNKEIAQKLNISEQTVKSHCNRIYKKVGVSDRLQLAIYLYKMHLI